MNSTILQIPVKKNVRDQAASVAEKMGFSSLQEIVRVFLGQLVANEITITFQHPPVKLSKKNELRYNKMIKEIESGKVKLKSYSNVDEMMDDLRK